MRTQLPDGDCWRLMPQKPSNRQRPQPRAWLHGFNARAAVVESADNSAISSETDWARSSAGSYEFLARPVPDTKPRAPPGEDPGILNDITQRIVRFNRRRWGNLCASIDLSPSQSSGFLGPPLFRRNSFAGTATNVIAPPLRRVITSAMKVRDSASPEEGAVTLRWRLQRTLRCRLPIIPNGEQFRELGPRTRFPRRDQRAPRFTAAHRREVMSNHRSVGGLRVASWASPHAPSS